MAEGHAERHTADQTRAALHALASYHDRRARDGGGRRCLIDRAETMRRGSAPRRRRVEIVERLERDAGVERAVAEHVYDIARDEGVDPAFAAELVRCGVSVWETEPTESGEAETTQAHPDWLSDPPPPQAARRERALRLSFRRLRRLLERYSSPADALVAFVNEPDVDEHRY